MSLSYQLAVCVTWDRDALHDVVPRAVVHRGRADTVFAWRPDHSVPNLETRGPGQ